MQVKAIKCQIITYIVSSTDGVSWQQGEKGVADNTSKRMFVSDLIPGLEIGTAVITEDGTVALSEGTILTTSLIERLRQWGILTVHVCRESGNLLAFEEAAYADAETSGFTAKRLFAENYEDTVISLHKTFETMRYLKEVPVDAMRAMAEETVCALTEAPGALNHLHMMQGYDDYTYQHSLNVAIITGLLGRWAGYTGTELRTLILAGLMHDIGKAQIPLELLNRPGKLLTSEMELMKRHTTRGYNLIKEHKDVPAGAVYGILQHHERMDGSGYPLGVPGTKIHPYAKIVAVADIYDAMTSERAYQKSSSPFEVVQTLVQQMFNKLDPEICTIFLNNVRDYFVGNVVALSDGRIAEVLYIAQFVGAKPIVRTQEGEFIDLEKRVDIKIASVVKA